MGSQALQGRLWGQRSADWANIQESTGMNGYRFALDYLKPGASDRILDIGCGAGWFAGLAAAGTGAAVTAIDAAEEMIREARLLNPAVSFESGEMEELPFPDQSFDIVTGFNSFQFAADTRNALQEAKRVLKDTGKLVAMIWGDKTDCETITYFQALAGLLPAPPPGLSGPFALTEDHRLEKFLEETGFRILVIRDVDSIWRYPDTETAMRGLLSTGPAARAIEHAGYEPTYAAIERAIQPFVRADGQVIQCNKFRVMIAEKVNRG